MATNSFFSHDSNARNSDKLIPVRMKHGAEGYAIYFMLLERLREEPDYTSSRDYEMLAFDLRVSPEKVKSVVEDFSLFSFTEDGERFYSTGFNGRMKHKDEKSEKARKSAQNRWSASKKNSDDVCERIENLCERNANASTDLCERNAIKEKKRKVKENISLSISPSSGDSESRGSLPLTEEERERIIFSFFLRNIKDYKQEAERFFAHYSATGWTRNGESIVDKVALSNTWEPKSKDKLLPPPLMGLWQAIGNALKWESPELIYGLHTIEVDRGVLSFYGTKKLMDILYQNEGILPSILNNQSVNADSWRFRVPKIA